MVRVKRHVSVLSVLCSISVLLICFMCGESLKNLLLSILLLIATICINMYTVSVDNKRDYGQATVLMTAVSLIFVALYFACGIVLGYERVVLKFSFMFTHVLPMNIMIVCTERIRSIFLINRQRMPAAVYILFVTLDVAVLWQSNFWDGYSSLMRAVGTVILPSIFAGMLYNYACKKYGAIPNVLYKSIVFTYAYFLPLRPVFPDALLSLARILLPLALYYFIVRVYESESFAIGRARSPARAVVSCATLILSAVFIILASGISKYKLIVIGSESMSGVMDRGDMIIYEEYEAQPLGEDQIILFERDGAMIAHRIVDIKNVGGEARYYTKGDANGIEDTGYVSDEQIVGICRLPLRYIGYPTVWIHDLIG